MKKIFILLTLIPIMLIAQPYAPNFQTGQPFNQPHRGGSNDCGSPINPIVNCGFESGDFTGWITKDMAAPFVPIQVVNGGQSIGYSFFTTAPTEGVFAALNGFDGGGPDTIEYAQDVTMPATAESLTFDYRGAWDMSFGATVDRTFEVQIQPSGGGAALQTTSIFDTSPVGSTVLDTGELTGSVNVTSFAGQSVRIAFIWNIPETNTGPGQFQLDNVAIVGPPPMIPSLSFYALLLTIVLLMVIGNNHLKKKSS